jgi:hypothetical protein
MWILSAFPELSRNSPKTCRAGGDETCRTHPNGRQSTSPQAEIAEPIEAGSALANEANESRIWEGIHYRSDIGAGAALGRAVANKVVETMQVGGSR